MELQLQYPPVWLTHHFTYFKYLFHQPWIEIFWKA
jgi:hypothetical protein